MRKIILFYVPKETRWNRIASVVHTPEIETVIDDTMRFIEKENNAVDGAVCSYRVQNLLKHIVVLKEK